MEPPPLRPQLPVKTLANCAFPARDPIIPYVHVIAQNQEITVSSNNVGYRSPPCNCYDESVMRPQVILPYYVSGLLK